MKTNIQTFKASELLAALAIAAPSVSIETIWEHDDSVGRITEECNMPEGTDPADWQAWQSEVRATAIASGKLVTGSPYLGGIWEKAMDHPSKSNPEISGYLPQMIAEALGDLLASCPNHAAEINAALATI